jgi:hypothetical protein
VVTSYSLNVDQRLLSKFVMELSYVGNHSDLLQGTANVNFMPLGTLYDNSGCGPSCQQNLRPYTQYQNVVGSVTAGKAQFDSLQASLQRNVGRLSLQVNYTWSKAMGVPADAGNLNNGTLQSALPDFGAHSLWGVQPLDRGHVLSAAYVYRLPGVQAGSGFLKGLTNDWELSGITQIESGPQLTAQSGSGGLNFGMSIPGESNYTQAGTPDVTLYPVYTCNPQLGLKKDQFINPSCFAPTPFNSLGDGHAPYLAGPMFWNTDLTVRKHVKITERQNVELQFSSFNPLNHGLLSFGSNDNNLKLAFDNNGKAPANFGVATHHFGHRVLEFGAKYNF